MPDWKAEIARRLAGLKLEPAREAEITEELAQHLEDRFRELVSGGAAEDEAFRAALAELSDGQLLAKGLRQVEQEVPQEPVALGGGRGHNFLSSVWQDVRYGLRQLRRNPGFAAVVVVTLALGIGANTAIFSLIDAVMLRSLPVRDPQHLFLFEWRAQGWPHGDYSSHGDCPDDEFGSMPKIGCSFPLLTVNEFRAQTNLFSGLAAFSTPRLQVTVNDRVVASRATIVSGDYFSTLGVKAVLGRTIEPSDDRPSAAPVAVLSYAFWQSAFGGKRSAIGRTIFLNQGAFTIVGVAEASFTNLSPGKVQDLWVPIATASRLNSASLSDIHDGMQNWWLVALARLKRGVSPQQAQAAASDIFRDDLRQSASLRARMTNPGILLAPATQGLTGLSGYYSRDLFIYMFAAGMILLIACANVAGLLVARGQARQKEVALRLAIGAGRGRIVRQLLTESLLLSGAGGVAGAGFAYGIVRVVTPLVSLNSGGRFPFVVGPDWRVLGFALSVTVLSGVFFGLAPALAWTRLDLTAALKENTPNRSGGARRFPLLSLDHGLVVAQVALGAVVLCGAGLLVHTLENLQAIHPGFDPRNVLLFRLDPTGLNYTPAHLENLYDRLRERLASLPGVQSVSDSRVPLLAGDRGRTSADIEGEPNESHARVDVLGIGPGFLRTMRIPLLRGRGFVPGDFRVALEKKAADEAGEPAPKGASGSEAPRIAELARIWTPVLVNETFVRRYLQGVDPVGEHIGVACCWAGSARIVGVVGDTKYSNLRRSVRPTVYFPYTGGRLSFELRTLRDPLALASGVRQIVRQADPRLPISGILTQAQAIDQVLWQERTLARLSIYFAALAVLLASVGLYGLLACEVARRRREIGVRMALGAQPGDVMRQIVRRGILLVGAGGTVGAGASLAVTRLFGSLLYDVRPTDPFTFLAVSILLLLVAVAACWIPARLASRVDPIVALRYE